MDLLVVHFSRTKGPWKVAQETDRKEVIISLHGNSLCSYPYTLSTFSIFSLYFFSTFSSLQTSMSHSVWPDSHFECMKQKKSIDNYLVLCVLNMGVFSFCKKHWLAFGVKVIIEDWKMRNWWRSRIREILLQVVMGVYEANSSKTAGSPGVNIHI